MSKKDTHYMGSVKVGPKGQIVIPKEVREMFGIEPGELLVLMADRKRGIALQKMNVLSKMAEAIFRGAGEQAFPGESQENLAAFAGEIRRVEKEETSE
jgi:AbrB family looped-hinge helix DNA binding protein